MPGSTGDIWGDAGWCLIPKGCCAPPGDTDALLCFPQDSEGTAARWLLPPYPEPPARNATESR